MKKAPLTAACLLQTGVVSTIETEVGLNLNREDKTMNRLRHFTVRSEAVVRKMRSLTVAIALCVMMFALAPLAVAQTPTELEEFRRDFGQALDQLYQYRATLRQNPAVREALAQANLASPPSNVEVQQQLQRMTHEELLLVHQALKGHFPNWREAPQALGQLAHKFGGKSPQNDQYPQSSKKGGINLNAITPDNCQDAFNAAPSWTDWGVTKAFEIAAQGAYEIIPPPLNALVMAAWIPLAEGGHASEILNLIFERCQGDQDVAAIQTAISNVQTSQNTVIDTVNASTTNLTTALSNSTTTLNNAITSAKTEIVNNDNSNKTTITTAVSNAQTNINNTSNANTLSLQTSLTTSTNTIVANDNTNKGLIVNNDNANTTTIVNNDNANKTALTTAISNAQGAVIGNGNSNTDALKAMLLRTQIEADLAEADNATPVGWYLTPTANGGYLDFVQTIVTATLASIQAAGGSIGDAQSFLTQANAQKAAGQFKAAYKSYRKAYKTAVNAS